MFRDLHYAHNGGFRLELYDANMTKIHEWADPDTWGCQVDATKQNVTITLPEEPCEGCILRFERQALEWGSTYLFRSCSLLDIVAQAGPNNEASCGGCSGRGTCAAGQCTCDSSAETGWFYGAHCEYENECETDAHCGSNGKCVDIGDQSGPAKQVCQSLTLSHAQPPSCLSVCLSVFLFQALVQCCCSHDLQEPNMSMYMCV